MPIHGLILAGGRARRMGGEDKGLVLLHGRPLVEHAIARLQPQLSGSLWISANRNLERYRQYSAQVVSDCYGYAGPLDGMLSALREIPAGDWLVTAPCDAPNAPPELVTRLWQAAEQAGTLAAMATDEQGRRQAVFSLLHKDSAEAIARSLEQGDGKIDRCLLALGCAEVAFAEAHFVNLNHPQELAQFAWQQAQAH